MTQSTDRSIVPVEFLAPYMMDDDRIIYTYGWDESNDNGEITMPNECIALLSSWLGAP